MIVQSLYYKWQYTASITTDNTVDVLLVTNNASTCITGNSMVLVLLVTVQC